MGDSLLPFWQESLLPLGRRSAVIVLGESHLRRIVSFYASYYNEARTHLSLAKDAPIRRPIEPFGCAIAKPMVRGLHHRYARF